MLKQLLSDGRKHLDYFFDRLDLADAHKVLDAIHACEGLVFLTGVGKSEVMARKIAVTMTSTGTRAIFIPPGNALHGDIGLISSNDIFLAFSKSGESEELLNLVPFVRLRGAKSIAIVSSPNNRLSRACDMTMVLPLQRELCPFDLAPTISTQIQMIFGDVLAMGLMNLKNFSIDDYAKNHPAGQIGRRIAVRVQDLMLKDSDLPVCQAHEKLVDILVTLSGKRCGCMLILNEAGKLEGIFTDGDLRRALTSKGPDALNTPIGEFMTKHPRVIHADALAWEAIKLMEANPKSPITVLAVKDDSGIVQGLIKMHDILQAGI